MEFEAVFITSVPAWLSFKVCGGLLTMPESIPGVPVDHYGLLSLLPTAFVITTAVLTHRPVAALLVGVDIMLEVMQDETIGWVIMVCGLMGSLIYILIKTGGASALATTWIRGRSPRPPAFSTCWDRGPGTCSPVS
jgi:hypothetical protein